MKSKFLSLLILSVVLLSCVSATVVVKGYFSNDVHNTESTITAGESITLKAVFSSTDTITQKNVQFPSGISSSGGQCISSNSGHTYTCTYSITSNTEGTYSIKLIGKDSSGSVDNDEVTLKVTPKANPADTIKPVITILGNNPATVYVSNAYTDAGATATDNVDGDITSKIQTTNAVNTNAIGTYTVTYTVSDNAKNTATATRTVNVIANPNPINHAPEIESINDDEVNENTYYSYQTEATDEDGDSLTYELTECPDWLYISSTGLIYGTADSVNLDEDYFVTVTVSDGEYSDSESYVLTVRDTSSPQNLPTIKVISPVENRKYTKSVITFKVETNGDAVSFRLDDGSTIYMHQEAGDSGDENYPNVFTYTATLSNGEHTVIFHAINEYGQSSETVDFKVKVGGSSGGCGSGFTVEDYPTTTTSSDIGGYSAVIANGSKKKNDLSILFYVLIAIIAVGILITSYALIRKISSKK